MKESPIKKNPNSRVRRRVIHGRSTEEWIELVMRHLGYKHWMFGCLSKNGDFFRICTLSTIRVPKNAIQEMMKRNLIQLKDDGFFKKTQEGWNEYGDRRAGDGGGVF